MKNLAANLIAAAFLTALGGCEQAQEAKNVYSAVAASAKASKGLAASLQDAQARQAERVKHGDTLAINYKELQKRLPASINGYEAAGDAKGQTMQMPGIHYSAAEREYKKGEETLKVTIMDYNGAAAMFTAATAMMSSGLEMETDDQVMRSTDLGITGVKAYETIEKKDHKSSLMMGVANRFFVTIEASGQTNGELVKAAAKSLDLEALSKL